MVCYNRQADRPKCSHPNPDHTGSCLNLEGWGPHHPGLRVVDGISDERSQKIFWAEVRQWHIKPWWSYIYVANTGSGSAENALRYPATGVSEGTRKFYLANNATQVRDWILRNRNTEFPTVSMIDTVSGPKPRSLVQLKGSVDQLVGQTITIVPPNTDKEHNMNRIEQRAESLRKNALRLLDEANRLESLPKEPVGTEDGTNVIWWQMKFRGGTRTYTYAAVQHDGKWSTTGPSSPKSYPWDELIAWITENDPEAVVWHASEWVTL